MARPVTAVLVALAFAALGAVILGEYELDGAVQLVAGVLFGLFVAEITATIARDVDRYLLGAVALAAEAGLVWAAWISTSHRLDLAPPETWGAVVAGAAAAAFWLRSAGRRGARSQTGGAPTPGG